MTFTLLPAVDVADAKAVRPASPTGTDATHGAREAALAWQAAGATWIHLVDLDAAFGRGSNAALLAAIVGELDVDVEVSGGISDDARLEWALSTGCARIVLGTSALGNPQWCGRVIAAHGDRIAVGLDAHAIEDRQGSVHHRLASRGRTEDRGDLFEAIEWLDHAGCGRYVITDVARDGMLQGPNVDLYRKVTGATATPVIASGGISAIEDLVVLAEMARAGANVEGSIVGGALYAGRFTLPEALEAIRQVEARPARSTSTVRGGRS